MELRACVGAGLAAALLTGCAAGVEAPAAAPTPVESVRPSAAASMPADSPTPTARALEVAYASGRVSGTSGREQVALGERVVLRISSDVAEEVHVHGYDVQQPVPAGGSVDIPLTATLPGGYEVELHESGKVLFQLRVE